MDQDIGNRISYDDSEGSKRYLPTLPERLGSLLDKQIPLEHETPEYLIELLAELLGIAEYKSNVAAFWFLDTLSLHLLRCKQIVDDRHRGVLISWLAGQMKFIQENLFSREEFFGEMERIFLTVAERATRTGEVPYWDSITNELLGERGEDSADSSRTIPWNEFDSTVAEGQEGDSMVLLNAIIDSTYDMYGGEARYYLIYSVFVRGVQTTPFYLSVTVKPPATGQRLESELEARIGESLGRKDLPLDPSNGGQRKKDKGKAKKTKKAKEAEELPVIPPTPPPSVVDDEIVTARKQFILPLIEANDASNVFQVFQSGIARQPASSI